MDKHELIYINENNGSRVEWDVRDIWKEASNVKTTTLNGDDIAKLVGNRFDSYTDEDLERVKKADISFPIIVSTDGKDFILVDGYHRIYRKIRGKGGIGFKAKIIKKMPKPKICIGKPFSIKGMRFDWVVDDIKMESAKFGNRKAMEEFILKAVRKMDVTGRTFELLKEQFAKMDDKRFHAWYLDIKEGKDFVPIYMENHMDGKRITTSHALDVCEEYGIPIFQRYWYRNPATGVKALSNKPVPFIHVMTRRQIETLFNKISVAEDNSRVDTLTGQPIGGASAITQPETLVYEEKGLEGSLVEKLKYRGGDIEGGRLFDQAIIETGKVSTTQLMEQHNTTTRVVQTADIYLTSAHYETNLDPNK